MLKKADRGKKVSNQDKQPPRTLQDLVTRYDLNNTKIYDFLDEFVDTYNLEYSKTLQRKGIVPVSDLNDLKEPGIYYVGATAVDNSPVTTWYGIFVITYPGTDLIHQYIFRPASGNFAMREYSGNPQSWKSWKSITLS